MHSNSYKLILLLRWLGPLFWVDARILLNNSTDDKCICFDYPLAQTIFCENSGVEFSKNPIIRLADYKVETNCDDPRSVLRNVLHHCRNIKSLSISAEAPLTSDDFENFYKVKDLYFHVYYDYTEAMLAQLFQPLRALESLTSSYNNFRTLPATLLVQQVNLLYLDLSYNGLYELPPQLFLNTTALSFLYLQGNRLRFIEVDTFAPLRKIKWLQLGDNQLYTLAPLTFAQNGNLEWLTLQRNKLRLNATASCAIFEPLSQLKDLILSYNGLTHLCNELGNRITPNLERLRLENNQLTRLDESLLSTWANSNKLRGITLGNNPWLCDCSAERLINYIKSKLRGLIADPENMHCTDPHLPRIIDLTFHDFCVPDNVVGLHFVIVIVLLSGVALLVTMCALCYYKYKTELKIWLYAHQLCLCCVSETELDHDRKYDAFISYSHMDEEFVERVLLPGLEQGTPPFKVCIHVRDWLAGSYIAEQIVESVEQSRRTIIVLSQHFIESDWARMEFRTAHQCSLNEGRARIVLIIYGELSDTAQLDSKLQAYLKMNTYLKWGDPWFWRKLRYAMPHQKSASTNRKTHSVGTWLKLTEVEVESGNIAIK